MAAESDSGRWEGYSDFNHVSEQIVTTINDATRALSTLRSAAKTGEKIRAKRLTDLRSDILDAVWQLRVELEHEKKKNGQKFAEEILTEWYGDGEELGWVEQVENAELREMMEFEFHGDMAHSIRRAGWELGYLQAGREKEADNNDGEIDGEVRDIIEGMRK